VLGIGQASRNEITCKHTYAWGYRTEGKANANLHPSDLEHALAYSNVQHFWIVIIKFVMSMPSDCYWNTLEASILMWTFVFYCLQGPSLSDLCVFAVSEFRNPTWGIHSLCILYFECPLGSWGLAIKFVCCFKILTSTCDQSCIMCSRVSAYIWIAMEYKSRMASTTMYFLRIHVHSINAYTY